MLFDDEERERVLRQMRAAPAWEAEAIGRVAEGGPGEDPHVAEIRRLSEKHREDSRLLLETSRPRAGETEVQRRIARICDDLRDFLIGKNKAYGNSALEPIGVFSKLPPLEGILLRIDDKLKRIKNGTSYPGDNDVKDLTGYLILLQVLTDVEKNDNA